MISRKALFLFLIPAAAWATDPRCTLVLKSSTYTELEGPRGALERPKFFGAIRTEMLRRSQALSKQIAGRSATPIKYDLVIVGSGPEAIALAQGYKQTNPSGEILMLQGAAELPKDDSRLAALYESGAQTLLGSGISVLGYSPQPKPGYGILLSQGSFVNADQVVYTSGEAAPAQEWIPVFTERGKTEALANRSLNADGTAGNLYTLGADVQKAELLGNQLGAPLKTRVFNLSKESAQAMIETLLQGVKPSKNPQIILMAGIPGSGKTTVAKKYIAEHFAPGEEPYIVDPDLLRPVLPGYVELLRQNPQLASLVSHRAASVQLQLPLAEALYERRANVLVDGSLRDYRFTRNRFTWLRKQYPEYKIHLIRVRLTPETALSRIKRRTEQTGRRVPVEMIEDLKQWDEQIELSMKVLRPMVDSYEEVSTE